MCRKPFQLSCACYSGQGPMTLICKWWRHGLRARAWKSADTCPMWYRNPLITCNCAVMKSGKEFGSGLQNIMSISKVVGGNVQPNFTLFIILFLKRNSNKKWSLLPEVTVMQLLLIYILQNFIFSHVYQFCILCHK